MQSTELISKQSIASGFPQRPGNFMMKAIGAARRARTSAIACLPTSGAPVHTANALGAWRLSRRLPSTGRLLVFRAAATGSTGPGCHVVKMASGALPRDAFAHALLRREASVAAEVNQSNLASVIGVNLRGTPAHIVLPYLDGITLRRLLASLGHLSAAVALGIVRQVASALTALHVAGWLHGQVRPEHVIVSPQGQATLIDLTQARRLNSGECDVSGDSPAAPVYSAPEMFAACRITSAIDTYALGVTLFEALAGRPPFTPSFPSQLAREHRQKKPPDVRDLRPEVSPDIGELLRRMLAKMPLRRPNDEQLVRWLTELEIEELA
jgi:serine/threonine protein kinase